MQPIFLKKLGANDRVIRAQPGRRREAVYFYFFRRKNTLPLAGSIGMAIELLLTPNAFAQLVVMPTDGAFVWPCNT